MNIQYKKLGIGDIDQLVGLIYIYADAFNMEKFVMPDRSYLQGLLANENIIYYVALYDNHPVGGLTAHILPSVYSQASEVYIYDLAVYAQYQRTGIGRQLISSLNHYCRTQGIKEVFVQADQEDRYALDFYRATGGKAENVVHFTYNLSK